MVYDFEQRWKVEIRRNMLVMGGEDLNGEFVGKAEKMNYWIVSWNVSNLRL